MDSYDDGVTWPGLRRDGKFGSVMSTYGTIRELIRSRQLTFDRK